MKIFITGAAGFLGSHLAEAFLARGDSVIGIDNLVGGDLTNVPEGVEFYECDCAELERVKVLMRGADVVYHLAATAHEGHSNFSPFENARHGYFASTAVFSAACTMKVGRLVFTSSMARFGAQQVPFREDMRPEAEDPYGAGKVAAEHTLRILGKVHDLPWVVAVPHSIIGPKQKFTDPFRNVAAIMMNLLLQKRRLIIYGDGEQRRCFSFVSDCVEPLVKMATSPDVVGEIINIGPDDEFVSVNELGRAICALMDAPFDPIYMPARPQEVKYANCSADKARRLLGYAPKVRLADGLRTMVDWVRSRAPNGAPFDYNIPLEIDNDKVPRTWRDRLF